MIVGPRCPLQLYPMRDLAAACAEEVPVYACSVEDAQLEGLDLSHLDIRGGRFTRCAFLGCDLERAAFLDVEFIDCDFSNAKNVDVCFERCRFYNCKCVGTDFSSAMMKNVIAQDCNFQMARFDRAQFHNTLFASCDWSDVFCREASLNGFSAEETRFMHVNFFNTSLRDVDFSNNDLTGLIVSDTLHELKGMIVTPQQSIDLVRLCGVRVK